VPSPGRKPMSAPRRVYKIPERDAKIVMDVRPDQLVPLRAGTTSAEPAKSLFALPVAADFYATAFGRDAKGRSLASPLQHLRAGLPPFLLVTAEHELPTCTR
jgi:hypothetical protein